MRLDSWRLWFVFSVWSRLDSLTQSLFLCLLLVLAMGGVHSCLH